MPSSPARRAAPLLVLALLAAILLTAAAVPASAGRASAVPASPAQSGKPTAGSTGAPTPTAPSPTAPSPTAPAQTPVPAPPADLGALAPAPDADVCARASRESPVAVDVTHLAPRAPVRADEPFEVAGRLVNCGQAPLDLVQVRLSVGSRITTRSELRLADQEPVVGSRRLPASDVDVDVLAPGASVAFSARVMVGDLPLGRRNGVYPLSVQARARADGDGTRGPVGLASTFVPWFPEGPVAPTRVAWVVPLVDEPHRAPDGVLLDEDLDVLLEPAGPGSGGRLARALAAGRAGASGGCETPARAAEGQVRPRTERCRGEPVPVTYAVDADLLHGVEAMTRPYAVRQGGETVERPASADAAAWLAAARAAAQEGDVLALPYGDPDVVALSRTESPVKDDVAVLDRLGESETRRLLGEPPVADLSWPPPGPVAEVVDPLAAGQDAALLLDESVLEPDPAQDRTPSARKSIPSTLGPVTALVADGALSALVETDPASSSWQGARLAEQRWIAETAVIAAERPGQSRTLVVSPRRQADLVPAVAANAVADTGRLPWLCGVPLAAVAVGAEGCATLPDPQGPAPVDQEAVLRSNVPGVRPLPPSYVRDIAEVRRAADQLTEQVLVPSGDAARRTEARLLRARGRASSTAWRAQPGPGRRMLELLRADVEALRSRIVLVGGPTLLTGRTGTLQLVVQNGLDQPVNVGVRLDPTSAVRLTSEDTSLQVVPGRSSQQVSVRVEARTSGRFTARAQLVDASGQPFGHSVELDVRSTEYGRVALAVTGIAAAVLLVAAGARIARRSRRPPEVPAEPHQPARPGSGV